MSPAVGTAVNRSIGVFAGGLVTWVTARYYYKRAGDKLKREAGRLRHLNTLILRALEERGLANLARDVAGEVTGLGLEVRASDGLVLGDSASAHDVRLN